jgi:competence protein ComEC
MPTPAVQSARIRVVCVLLSWCAGITIARSFKLDNPLLSFSTAGIVLASMVVFRRRQWTRLAMLLAILLLASGWTAMRTSEGVHMLDRKVRMATAEHMVPIECRGLILSRVSTQHTPRLASDSPRWSNTLRTFDISVRQIRVDGIWVRADGRLRVVLPEDSKKSIHAGQIASIIGPYRPPGGPRNPGDPDWSAISNQNNLVGSIYIKHDELLTTQPASSPADRITGPLWNLRAHLQSRAINTIGLESADSPPNALIGALILGYRDPGFHDIYQSFQRIGIAHMLAISGFHVAVMLALAVLIVRLFGEHPRLELLVVMFVVGAILILLPLRPPILRAVIIVVALLCAGGLGRRYDRVSVLLLIATCLLIHRPLDLFSLGYQLSIGITALLLMLPKNEQPVFAQQRHAGVFRSFTRTLWSTARTNTACWLVATPAIMLQTGVLSILAPIATLLMLPAILVMMIAGYTQLGAGMLWPALSELVRPVTGWLSDWSTSITIWLDSLPGSSVHAPNLGTLWTIAATCFLAAVVLRPSWRKVRLFWSAGAAVLVWASILIFFPANSQPLRVDMLDVGNGSSLIIRSGKDTILFDAGSLDRRIDTTLRRASHHLGALPVRTAFVSHDNLDHFNALLNAPQQLALERVYITQPLFDHPSRAWVSVRDKLLEQGIELLVAQGGDRITFDGCTAEVLWPPKDSGFESAQDNNSSFVIRWVVQTEAGVKSLLTTGDIETETMIALMDLYPDLQTDIIEIPHHGSPSTALLQFLKTLNPTVALQSTGQSRLNDPRLAGARSRYLWYATADKGAAWAEIGKDSKITAGWSRHK